VPVCVRRELLEANLRTYGEDELAARISTLSDAEMQKIGEVADRYLYTPERPLIAKAVAMATVEVLEGAGRPLKRARRRLKGIYPGM
jgi:hypothetical protein